MTPAQRKILKRRLRAVSMERIATCSYMPLDSEHVAWLFADPGDWPEFAANCAYTCTVRDGKDNVQLTVTGDLVEATNTEPRQIRFEPLHADTVAMTASARKYDNTFDVQAAFPGAPNCTEYRTLVRGQATVYLPDTREE